MRQSVTIFLLFLVFCAPLLSQEEDRYFQHLNATTYEHYLKQDWKSLIRLGNIGLKRGIDYYYLRMRVGIAYYESGHYRQSIPHFLRALKFNLGDPVALEYLYYAYLFSGRNLDAMEIYYSMGSELKKKIRTGELPAISSLFLNYQLSMNEHTYGITDFQNISNTQATAIQPVLRWFNYFNLDLEHRAGKRINIHHAYTYLNKSESFYYQDSTIRYIIPSRNINQHQYYFSSSLLSARGLTITGSLHLLYQQTPGYVLGGQGGWGNNISVSPTSNLLTVSYLSITKDLGCFNFGLSSSYANLENRNMFQKDLGLIIFPLGNLNLYSVSRITWNTVYNNNVVEGNHLILNQTMGFRLASWWWAEFSTTQGNLYYYVDKQGLLVYNSPEIYKEQYGVTFIFPVTRKKFDIYLRYFYSIGRSFLVYAEDQSLASHNLDISIHSINGGIKWNF